MKNFLFLTVLTLTSLVFFTTSCTRKNGHSSSLTLDLSSLYNKQNKTNKGINKVSSQSSSTDKVVKVAINVHGGPQIVEAGWESCHCLPDDQLEQPPATFTLNLTEGTNRLVQVLIVTESSEGKAYFDYGDKVINIVKGENQVEIIVSSTMASEDSAEAGVRYLRADGTGPSGLIDLIYKPAADRPSMIVHSISAVGGWMKLHLFSSTLLDYRVRATGEILFSGLNFNHPDFQPSNQMIKVKIPSYYGDKQHDNAAPYEQMPAKTLYLGFVGPGASGQMVCYDPTDNLALSKAWLDSNGTSNLLWSGTTSNTTQFTRLGGGVSNASGTCANGVDYVNKLTFWSDRLEGDWVNPLFGFEDGFQLIKGSYGYSISTAFYQSHINASQISWKYLPGTFVGNDSIAGSRLFRRLNTSSTHLNMNDYFDCSTLPSLGFTEVANLPAAASNSYLMQGLTAADVYSYQVVICPYTPSGKFIIGMAGNSQNLGEGPLEFGNGSDGNIAITSTVSLPSYDTTVLGGKILMAKRDIFGISADGRTLQLSGSTLNTPYQEFSVGDEVIWMVVAESGVNGCGSELNAGDFGFNKIDSMVTSPPTIQLQAPMVLNGGNIAAATLQSSSYTNGSEFCRLFIQRVPQFKNLDLSATTAVNTFTATGLPYAITGGGGLIALRVMDTLSFIGNYNFIITASGSGYGGGTYSSQSSTGIGPAGYITNYLSSIMGAGGGFDLYGGGGGGGAAGAGGNGGSASGTQSGGQGGFSLINNLCSGSCNSLNKLFYGAGGGSGNVTSGGGQGGGAIFISASKIQRTSGTGTTYIRVDGSNGIDIPATNDDAGGGGGGGSIQLKTKQLDTSLYLSARGGPGGNATGTGTSRGGGGGGGGLIYGQACSGTGAFVSPDVTAGIPGTGVESNGASGSAGTYQTNMNSNAGSFCYN